MTVRAHVLTCTSHHVVHKLGCPVYKHISLCSFWRSSHHKPTSKSRDTLSSSPLLFVCLSLFVSCVLICDQCSFLSRVAHRPDLSAPSTLLFFVMLTCKQSLARSLVHVKGSTVGGSSLVVWVLGCISRSDANILSHCFLSAHRCMLRPAALI